MTWSWGAQPELVALITLVSDIGEQWSPNTDPAITALSAGNNKAWSKVNATSAPIGIIIANVPQLDPVVNAIIAHNKKVPAINTSFERNCSAQLASNLATPRSAITAPIIQVKSKIEIAKLIERTPDRRSANNNEILRPLIFSINSASEIAIRQALRMAAPISAAEIQSPRLAP